MLPAVVIAGKAYLATFASVESVEVVDAVVAAVVLAAAIEPPEVVNNDDAAAPPVAYIAAPINAVLIRLFFGAHIVSFVSSRLYKLFHYLAYND